MDLKRNYDKSITKVKSRLSNISNFFILFLVRNLWIILNSKANCCLNWQRSKKINFGKSGLLYILQIRVLSKNLLVETKSKCKKINNLINPQNNNNKSLFNQIKDHKNKLIKLLSWIYKIDHSKVPYLKIKDQLKIFYIFKFCNLFIIKSNTHLDFIKNNHNKIVNFD